MAQAAVVEDAGRAQKDIPVGVSKNLRQETSWQSRRKPWEGNALAKSSSRPLSAPTRACGERLNGPRSPVDAFQRNPPCLLYSDRSLA